MKPNLFDRIKYPIDGKEATRAWLILCIACGVLFIADVISIVPFIVSVAWPFFVTVIIIGIRIIKEYRRGR